jgi:hypothetical protein
MLVGFGQLYGFVCGSGFGSGVWCFGQLCVEGLSSPMPKASAQFRSQMLQRHHHPQQHNQSSFGHGISAPLVIWSLRLNATDFEPAAPCG